MLVSPERHFLPACLPVKKEIGLVMLSVFCRCCHLFWKQSRRSCWRLLASVFSVWSGSSSGVPVGSLSVCLPVLLLFVLLRSGAVMG